MPSCKAARSPQLRCPSTSKRRTGARRLECIGAAGFASSESLCRGVCERAPPKRHTGRYVNVCACRVADMAREGAREARVAELDSASRADARWAGHRIFADLSRNVVRRTCARGFSLASLCGKMTSVAVATSVAMGWLAGAGCRCRSGNAGPAGVRGEHAGRSRLRTAACELLRQGSQPRDLL